MFLLEQLELWIGQVVILDALLVKAWETSAFIHEAFAWMATLVDFIATRFHQFNAAL